MELFDSFTNILSLLFGGSLISIVTWKFARRKAEAEAKKAEAEAKQAEAEATEAKQDYYQQMLADLAKDRDYYKQDRDEHRRRLDEMDVKMRELQAQVARNGRKVDAMVPFMCADMGCKLRKRVTISDEGEISGEKVEKAKNSKVEK
ncbi:MAG: hypothetical protein IIW37_01950 [Bacteroidaceae bacterium]|nr:hypothetical protein [Bacteroidaceae bacterium]